MRAERLLVLPIVAVLITGLAVAVARSGNGEGPPVAQPEITLTPEASPTFTPPSVPPSAVASPSAPPITPSASIPPGEVNPNSGQPGTSPGKQKPELPGTGVPYPAGFAVALVGLAIALGVIGLGNRLGRTTPR